MRRTGWKVFPQASSLYLLTCTLLYFNMVFPHGSDLQWGRPGLEPWVGKIPWRREWQSTPVLLPWRIPWTEEPGYSIYIKLGTHKLHRIIVYSQKSMQKAPGLWDVRHNWRDIIIPNTERCHDWMLSAHNFSLFPRLAARIPASWLFSSRQEIGRLFSDKHNQPKRKDWKILTSRVNRQTDHPYHLTVSFKGNKPYESNQSNRLYFSPSFSIMSI